MALFQILTHLDTYIQYHRKQLYELTISSTVTVHVQGNVNA